MTVGSSQNSSSPWRGCIVALDLGTTAFKAAAVTEAGVCCGISVTPYALEYGAEQSVTCDPWLYVRVAIRTLRRAVRSASAMGLDVEAIGLTSQAQTFVPVDAESRPVGPAIVWTDFRAEAEAEEAARCLPDFAETCGFVRPSALQFLPKVMRLVRTMDMRACRFLLLNEWVALNLTGTAFGDTNLQAMGGFLDMRGSHDWGCAWNAPALDLAGISSDQLATIGPAASISAPTRARISRTLGLSHPVAVYSCGNDQSCAAVGAGLEDTRDVFANFGTALVVYALKDRPVVPAASDQIAGISPLPRPGGPQPSRRRYLLGVESECGNMFEWLAGFVHGRGKGVARVIDAALALGRDSALPDVVPRGGATVDILGLRLDMTPAHVARSLLERYAARFGDLVSGVMGRRPRRVLAAGGLSRSRAWLDFLSERQDVRIEPAGIEHPGLVGAARIIRRAARDPLPHGAGGLRRG